MAATEACAAPIKEDGVTEPKLEVETTAPTSSETVNNEVVNKETVNNEVVTDEAAGTENAGASPATEEAQPGATDATPADGAEQPAESKAKPAHDGIWDSFLNKSGLGKVMGGKKKKEQTAGAEDANTEPQEKVNGEEAPAEGAEAEAAGSAEEQTIEKAPDGEEPEGKKEGKEAKPKQGEKSSVRDMIRKPVARIFSHRSTEKKDGAAAAAAEPPKQITVRSKSLDRLEDPEALNTTADQAEDVKVADDEAQKASAASTSTKHMKRWHSFKKLMAQRSHKKSSDDPKDTEVVEGGAEAGAGDSSTLDSKGENSGQKRWKLKRSWTFQGLKRDSSVVGISKVAKGSDKDAADGKGEETTVDESEQAAAAGESEEAKPAVDGEAEKVEGEEDKGAAAAAAPGGTVSQHANEIWTSFKKRVTPKSKKPATESAASVEEEGGAAAAAAPASSADQEQTEEPAAAGKEGKSAKAKRTHFNRAVSLKNFILRKGKSTSVDQPEEAPKEGEEDAAAADGKTETPPGEVDGAAQGESKEEAETPAANDHVAEGAAEEKQTDEVVAPVAEAAPTPNKSAAAAEAAAATPPPEPAAAAVPEVTTNGENGCTNGMADEDATHNHESSPTKKDEANSTVAGTTEAKICKASQGNAVAQSEKKAGNV